jgi:hypothetical protein
MELNAMILRRSQSIVSLFLLLVAGCSGGGDGDSGSPPGVPPVAHGADASPGSTLNGGLGQVCETAAECKSGLTCRTDTADWIAHKQCTSACSDDTDCQSKYGSHTMCIGAHICVSKCLDDADCPSGTQCSEYGWCNHTGPGSGVPKCVGTPTPCGLLSGTECAGTLGCTTSGSCGGVAESCYSQYSQYACDALTGCYWSSTSRSCSGITTPCTSHATESSCRYQSGCHWSSACTGQQSATSCESQGAALCKYAPGCTLVNQ